jgi:hypothetical protein
MKSLVLESTSDFLLMETFLPPFDGLACSLDRGDALLGGGWTQAMAWSSSSASELQSRLGTAQRVRGGLLHQIFGPG